MTSANHPLGQLAYETYFLASREAEILYPAWESRHPAQQIGWQRAAEAIWIAAFQAGADSAMPQETIG